MEEYKGRRGLILAAGLTALLGAGAFFLSSKNKKEETKIDYQKAQYAADFVSRTDELSPYTLIQEGDGKDQPESYPYLIVAKMDYKPFNKSGWDAVIIGSLITHPELAPKNYENLEGEDLKKRRRADFKEQVSNRAPGLELFFTKNFKREYGLNKALRERVAQDIGNPAHISFLTPEQERQVNEFEDIHLVPQEHWTQAPQWYINKFAEAGLEKAQEEQKRRKGN